MGPEKNISPAIRSAGTLPPGSTIRLLWRVLVNRFSTKKPSRDGAQPVPQRGGEQCGELRATVIEQRSLFIEDAPIRFARGAEHLRRVGYAVRYKHDRQPPPLSGWWVSRPDNLLFQQDEVPWLIRTLQG